MKFYAKLFAWTALVLCLSPVILSAQSPNYILYNGKILTVDNNFSIAQAVAITGTQITAVGTDAAVLPMAAAKTVKVDLKGRTVIPGLVDSHRHMYSYAEGAYGRLLDANQRRRYSLHYSAIKTKADILAQVRDLVEEYKLPKGTWMYLTGGPGTLDRTKILYDELTQWDLDTVSPNNPVAMGIGIPDFNGFMLNKAAMDLLQAKHGDFIKKFGRFWVDASGRPDGHLEPPASRLVLPYTYDRKAEDLAMIYKLDMDEMNSMGLTTVDTRLPADSRAAYEWLLARSELTVRVGQGVVEAFGNIDDPEKGLAAYKSKVGTGSDEIWITGVGPTAIDGSTTRACTDQKRTGGAYGILDSWFPVGQCHTDSEYKGSPKRAGAISGNYYRDWVYASADNGIRFANVHAAGDRAVGNMLNFIEDIQKTKGRNATKDWALDHCDMVNPKDFPRIAKDGVTMSCYIRLNRLGDMAQSYGDKIANTFHAPAQSMLNAGAKVVIETDSDSYIWKDMEDFVVRKDRNGKVWGPQDRVDHPTVLKMTTSWAAGYVLKPDKLGSIEKGKLADLVVLDKDFLAIPDEQIHTIVPQITIMDGNIVYVNTDYARENNFRPAGSLISNYEDLKARRPAPLSADEVSSGG
jgi:predicted amidohydrolase YtcJ